MHNSFAIYCESLSQFYCRTLMFTSLYVNMLLVFQCFLLWNCWNFCHSCIDVFEVMDSRRNLEKSWKRVG